ncbi:MAG: hypothetical protein LHV69_08640 [Elusimicrobia bacterium]|nr:hypothetical protein [Candidatus Obscuribacterium magneticum]
MKKILTLIAAITLSPLLAWGKTTVIHQPLGPHELSIPARFASSSETAVMEWGCPVSELVEAASSADAIQKIGESCMAEAKRAATEKPEVFDVIRVSVILPDVDVSKEKNGFYLEGTFFLETLVLKGMGQ